MRRVHLAAPDRSLYCGQVRTVSARTMTAPAATTCGRCKATARFKVLVRADKLAAGAVTEQEDAILIPAVRVSLPGVGPWTEPETRARSLALAARHLRVPADALLLVDRSNARTGQAWTWRVRYSEES